MTLTDLGKYAKLKEIKITPKHIENEISAYLKKTSILESQVYWIVGNDRRNLDSIEVFNRNMHLPLSDKNNDWIFLIHGMKRSTRITAYFQKIAGELGYDALDPIVDYNMPEVSNRAGVQKEEALLSHVILNDLGKKDMVKLAVNYGVQIPYLQDVKKKFEQREVRGDPFYKKIKDKAKFTLETLYDISNEMTRENIESVISKHNYVNVFMFTDVSCKPLLDYYANNKSNNGFK